MDISDNEEPEHSSNDDTKSNGHEEDVPANSAGENEQFEYDSDDSGISFDPAGMCTIFKDGKATLVRVEEADKFEPEAYKKLEEAAAEGAENLTKDERFRSYMKIKNKYTHFQDVMLDWEDLLEDTEYEHACVSKEDTSSNHEAAIADLRALQRTARALLLLNNNVAKETATGILDAIKKLMSLGKVCDKLAYRASQWTTRQKRLKKTLQKHP